MSKVNDFVYKQVYKGCLDNGVKDGQAAIAAALASERFRKGRYDKTPSKLIQEAIKDAVKSAKR